MFILTLLGVVAVLYAGLCAFLYFQQDSFIFYRVVNDAVLADRWKRHRVDIGITDTTVEGWWARNPDSRNDLFVLYFGGNAEDVLHAAESAGRIDARCLLLTNYRGYGQTPGKPSERAILSDALAIYDWLIRQPGVTADKIVVMGRSLGSGVATHIAAHRPIRSAVLITPYDSIARVGQAHFPYVPVARLLNHPFDSESRAKSVDAPALLIAAERDNVVPIAHARKLFEAWRGPKEIHVLRRVGHNDVDSAPEYYRLINEFLAAR
jgi:uncharacterized protein